MIKNTEGRGDGYRSRIICSTSSLPSHKELKKIIKSLKSLKKSMQSLLECETDPGEQPEKKKKKLILSLEDVNENLTIRNQPAKRSHALGDEYRLVASVSQESSPSCCDTSSLGLSTYFYLSAGSALLNHRAQMKRTLRTWS